MNELVSRLINYLERERVVQRLSQENGPVAASPEEQIESIFVGGLFFLEKFSRIIELAVLERRLQGGRMFFNFQSFANLGESRRARWHELDALENDVYVYGIDDPEPWPYRRIRPVRLTPRDSLRRSWFVLYDSPGVSYALVAMGRVVSGGSPKQIQYRGFWTTRSSVTHSVRDYLLRVVNVQYGVSEHDRQPG